MQIRRMWANRLRRRMKTDTRLDPPTLCCKCAALVRFRRSSYYCYLQAQTALRDDHAGFG